MTTCTLHARSRASRPGNPRSLARVLIFALLSSVGWVANAPVRAADAAATIDSLRGNVSVRRADGRVGSARRGSSLYTGDVISTARRAAVSVEFADESRMVLNANSEFAIEEYRDTEDEDEGLVTSVLRGAFRFVSGLIARRNPRRVQIRTPVALIGIRGTHFGGEVTATSARIVLLDPEDEPRPTAIEVSNDFGAVVIDEPGFGTEVPDENSPPSPVRRMRLRMVDQIMRSMRSIQRVRPMTGGHR